MNITEEQKKDMDTLNTLLETSMNTLLYSPSQQRQRVERELEQKYIDAQMSLETAPIVLEDTKRNYYVFKEGENYYNEMLETELTNKANELTKLIKNNFRGQIRNAKILYNYYENDMINSNNSKELYNKYKKENKYLEKQITDEYGDILTNNRKTYYSNEALDRLKLWYRFMWYIYYILVIVLTLGFLLVDSNLNKISKILITIIMLVYPYIIDPILRWFYKQFKLLYNKLPKNVYNNI
jgi:hypothetical protein